ncbi:glucose dehydrogenase [Pseudooceanicola sediminis]|uniref:Glucose dehydrogenase n=1 Tax=Pseudooceanicola sediminis TaxID=2211117 RepID=A0A399IY97_9RHOB|nr:glucose dehydrogenase [Pseudooceanicola sediminis]KAA2316042.1 glucose dehydrogenase [Puniceibacterium sp. HSS470]RII38153.1 glucose dehydrogenase [Pseudooceanicola sediminis]
MTSTQSVSARTPVERHWAILVLGWVLVIFGAVLLAGGIWLIVLGGSWYYGLAGLGLIVTGALLNRASMAAVWLYLVIWLATVVWAYWEVGTDWWAQVPRLVAPTLVLVLILICIPGLTGRSRRQTY